MRTLLLLVLVVGGCVKATPVKGPDPKRKAFVLCSSSSAEMYNRAAKLCPAGYTIDKSPGSGCFQMEATLLQCK